MFLRSLPLRALAFAVLAAAPALAADSLVLLGTYGSGPGIGFSQARFDDDSGRFTQPTFVMSAKNPGFFVIHPDGRHLYACDEDSPGEVSAYRLDAATGGLTLLNTQSSAGLGPAYVSLDRSGRFALVANYGSGTIAVFAIDPDGSLGRRTAFVQHTGRSVDPVRQTHAYAHSILVDPSNRFALVADLGTDKVVVYRFNASDGSLSPNEPAFARVAPGSGPRHIRFHPSGRWAYVVNEMASTVTAFAWDPERGSLAEVQTISTLPAGFSGVSTAAEIEVHPNGRFLYSSNRGYDSLAVFSIDPANGRLTLMEIVPSGGRTPRFFTLDPGARWLLCGNQDSDNVVVFRIDPATGRLTRAGGPVPARIPVCLGFVPTLP
jgi:6-phosphogluconolactonase